VHHSSEHLDWLATSRVHPLDLTFNITAATLPAAALGYLAAQPWLVAVQFLYPFLLHANARVRLPAVGCVLVCPEFHHWHHAAATKPHGANFGAFLSVWDRLLGTAHEPGGFPDRYGIGDARLAEGDYLCHLLAPPGAD
jgi:sterol desaturase/sphingolipid hydroxylase (fatty acid hydroxylase superfamily)